MFIPGIIFVIIGIVLTLTGITARKKGNIQGANLGTIGKIGIVAGVVLIVASGIRIIDPGEVGVLDLFGKVQEKEIYSGINLVNPLMKVHPFSVKTQEIKESMMVPSQEGLQVDLEVSILFRMKADAASDIFMTIGSNYENIVIMPMFRSAARDVTVRYDAKALYTSSREIISQSIFDDLKKNIDGRGFILENVLLRSITLPPTVTNAIEDKVKAEQEAQKMQFVLQKESQEAERKRIEAGGIRDANKVIAEGLTDSYIRWYRIEMLKQLVNSPNNTIIIIPEDLKSVPMIMNTK